ncbi:uncharacterized protein LOC133533331 [Cydia pomonella]|uniref:uncharacterized protein LOC133533331 n=1 Tax=Cydia pomonella TaxID=82600 RepID=UPI002ADD957D|nr:uncharacterized protein LOC133533331 [Cydia pomonella]
MALKKPKGYLLLQKDFEHLYTGKYTDIIETFPTLKPKIFEFAKTRKNSSKDKNLELLLSLEQGSEDTSNIACFLLIPSLLAVTSVRLRNTSKKIWRPSKAESTAGFILHVRCDSEIRNAVKTKQNKFQELGLTVQPFIIIVGESLEKIKTYFIVINEIYYTVSSILTAVSLCFKITWVVNAQYPVECHSTWMFIQAAFFKFRTKFDSNSTSALTLLGELGIDC